MKTDEKAVELTEDNIGPMPTFLAQRLTNRKKLNSVEIDGKLGKYACPGLSGTLTWKEGANENRAEIVSRQHPKAPFGVVTSEIDVVTSRDGRETNKGKLTFRLTDFGFDAKSKLPDNQ